MSITTIDFPDGKRANSHELESFFDREIKTLEELTDNQALAQIFRIIMYVNILSDKQRLGLLDKLIGYLRKLQEKLDSIAKEWHAGEYSINVGFPWGVSVSLTFTPQEQT